MEWGSQLKASKAEENLSSRILTGSCKGRPPHWADERSMSSAGLPHRLFLELPQSSSLQDSCFPVHCSYHPGILHGNQAWEGQTTGHFTSRCLHPRTYPGEVAVGQCPHSYTTLTLCLKVQWSRVLWEEGTSWWAKTAPNPLSLHPSGAHGYFPHLEFNPIQGLGKNCTVWFQFWPWLSAARDGWVSTGGVRTPKLFRITLLLSTTLSSSVLLWRW